MPDPGVVGVETNLGKRWPIGAAFTFRVLMTDNGKPPPQGTPTDLNGRSYILVLRTAAGATVFSEASPTMSSVNGTRDALDFTVESADTSGATAGQGYQWSVWRTDNPNDRPEAFGTVELFNPGQQP